MFMLEVYWVMSKYFSVDMLFTFSKEWKIHLNSNLAALYSCDIGLLHD